MRGLILTPTRELAAQIGDSFAATASTSSCGTR
jgi:superfamily II DNA/RNA helicase